MKAKKTLATLAVIAALAVPFSVFAATSDNSAAKSIRGLFRIDTSKLTDEQKTDVANYSKKMADLKKEFINKMVDNGSMTKENGDAAIKRIDDAASNGNFSKGMLGGGLRKHVKDRDLGLFGIDMSKLTDAQKSDLTASFKMMAELEKELINKEIASGLLTQEQGDAAIQRIDESIENGEILFGMGKAAGFGMRRANPSTLTDAQKSDLTEHHKKMTEAQKELVNKMVANGAMTKEQGDAAIQRIDERLKDIEENGFTKGTRMDKKVFGRHRR